MKNLKAVLALAVLIILALPQIGFAQMAQSAHDFRNASWVDSNIKNYCTVCHTPHNALAVPDAPLWTHATTTAPFTVYTSPTLDATVNQPDGASKMCLSCHDGTVALDSFGGVVGTTTMSPTDEHFLGTDLKNDHPISFTYDTALSTTDGGLADPSTVNSGLGGTIAQDLLFNGKVQCASCHDVHNGANIDKLLRLSNVGDALCITCHTK